MPNANLFNEEVGLLRRGWITDYDSTTGQLFVKLNNAPLTSNNPEISVQAPHAMFYNNGLFIGTVPYIGTPVVVSQGSGGEYHFVSFLAENQDLVPELNDGELLIRSNERTKITLDLDNKIVIGSDGNRIELNTNNNYISTNFHNQFKFSQAGLKVDGIVKRDLVRNTIYDQNFKLENNNYDGEMYVVALDPTASVNNVITGSSKNPPFVEQRELTYEFQQISDIADDLTESTGYSDTGTKNQNYKFPNRRKSRADTLSLSLVAPNYLIETVKGTVVDIFGNILDLNRYPLPVGKDTNTLRPDKSTDKVKSFLNIKEIQRKSLAYHFEINARKDLSGKGGQVALPNIQSSDNYARDRARFFVDIDKEGQFKINVPASSEKGNIPLLARYENYSTYGTEDNGNPNKLVQLDNNQDIFLDSFVSLPFQPTNKSRGSVSIKYGDGAEATPIDRLTKAHIRHGMVYHDIMQTCFAHQTNDWIKNIQAGTTTSKTVDLSTIPPLKTIVSDTILVSGNQANAGGRSGSINMDGSLELNIGANTVDRQSLWMDLAGGMVSNIGRDIRGRSAIANMSGDFYLQIGGIGVAGDSRFKEDIKGEVKGAVMDLRVLTNGITAHIIRIDDTGITIMTPQDLRIHSKGNMAITSDSDIRIECETLTIQERMLNKVFGGSI